MGCVAAPETGTGANVHIQRLFAAGLVAGLLSFALHGPVGAEEGPLPPSRPNFPQLPLPPEPQGIVGLPTPSAGRAAFLPLISSEARARGLPPEVADAVARIESGYNSAAVGGDGERGMMQVMPPTAAMLGFKGTREELAQPANNIRLGVSYLADAWKLANGDLCRALMKYRAGHNQERMSALSVEYCRRAKTHLASIGSPLAAGPLPAAEFGTAPVGLGSTFLGARSGVGSRSAGVQRVAGRLVRVASRRLRGASFWAAHTARIRAIEARLPWKRGGIIAGG